MTFIVLLAIVELTIILILLPLRLHSLTLGISLLEQILYQWAKLLMRALNNFDLASIAIHEFLVWQADYIILLYVYRLPFIFPRYNNAFNCFPTSVASHAASIHAACEQGMLVTSFTLVLSTNGWGIYVTANVCWVYSLSALIAIISSLSFDVSILLIVLFIFT